MEICLVVISGQERGQTGLKMETVRRVNVRNTEYAPSIKRCCPSAPPDTFSPCLSLIYVRDTMFLRLSIYYSSVLGGTTDQSVVDSQY